MDQKGLMFPPHITVVQDGTTVDFLNSDSVAHNVFWPSVGGNKKLTHNLGTWPKGEKRSFKFDNPGACHCSATFTRRWRATSSCRPLRISRDGQVRRTTRSKTFPTEATP